MRKQQRKSKFKIFALIAALFMALCALTLAACGGGGGSNKDYQVKITYSEEKTNAFFYAMRVPPENGNTVEYTETKSYNIEISVFVYPGYDFTKMKATRNGSPATLKYYKAEGMGSANTVGAESADADYKNFENGVVVSLSYTALTGDTDLTVDCSGIVGYPVTYTVDNELTGASYALVSESYDKEQYYTASDLPRIIGEPVRVGAERNITVRMGESLLLLLPESITLCETYDNAGATERDVVYNLYQRQTPVIFNSLYVYHLHTAVRWKQNGNVYPTEIRLEKYKGYTIGAPGIVAAIDIEVERERDGVGSVYSCEKPSEALQSSLRNYSEATLNGRNCWKCDYGWTTGEAPAYIYVGSASSAAADSEAAAFVDQQNPSASESDKSFLLNTLDEVKIVVAELDDKEFLLLDGERNIVKRLSPDSGNISYMDGIYSVNSPVHIITLNKTLLAGVEMPYTNRLTLSIRYTRAYKEENFVEVIANKDSDWGSTQYDILFLQKKEGGGYENSLAVGSRYEVYHSDYSVYGMTRDALSATDHDMQLRFTRYDRADYKSCSYTFKDEAGNVIIEGSALGHIAIVPSEKMNLLLEYNTVYLNFESVYNTIPGISFGGASDNILSLNEDAVVHISTNMKNWTTLTAETALTISYDRPLYYYITGKDGHFANYDLSIKFTPDKENEEDEVVTETLVGYSTVYNVLGDVVYYQDAEGEKHSVYCLDLVNILKPKRSGIYTLAVI